MKQLGFDHENDPTFEYIFNNINENYDKNFSLLEQFHITKSNYDNKMSNLNLIEQTIAKMKEEIASISQRNIEKEMKINK